MEGKNLRQAGSRRRQYERRVGGGGSPGRGGGGEAAPRSHWPSLSTPAAVPRPAARCPGRPAHSLLARGEGVPHHGRGDQDRRHDIARRRKKRHCACSALARAAAGTARDAHPCGPMCKLH